MINPFSTFNLCQCHANHDQRTCLSFPLSRFKGGRSMPLNVHPTSSEVKVKKVYKAYVLQCAAVWCCNYVLANASGITLFSYSRLLLQLTKIQHPSSSSGLLPHRFANTAVTTPTASLTPPLRHRPPIILLGRVESSKSDIGQHGLQQSGERNTYKREVRPPSPPLPPPHTRARALHTVGATPHQYPV